MNKVIIEEKPIIGQGFTASELYFEYVKYINEHSFTHEMLKFMLREFVAITSLVVYDDNFREIMERFKISCQDVEPQLNSL